MLFENMDQVKSTISRFFILVFLFVYLIIPFKQQFLQSLHFTSHLIAYQDGYHFHDHGSGVHDHNHTLLESMSHALEGRANSRAIPVDLQNFEFQIALFSKIFLLTDSPFFKPVQYFIPQRILTQHPFLNVPSPPP